MKIKTSEKHILIADWYASDIAIEEELLKSEGYTISLSGINTKAQKSKCWKR